MPVFAAAVPEIVTEEEETEIVRGNFDLPDGVYKGEGTGFAGKITVSVEVKDKNITTIEILEVEADDAAFFNRAKGVIDKIIEAQSLEVDAVSGATYSSNGIINAVKNALTGEVDSGKTAAGAAASTGTPTVSHIQEASAYNDGTYYGTGTGFVGPLTVEVQISGGKITSIKVTKTSDGSSYVQSASGVISSIIAQQSTNVDTVSGATYSSVGIIEAVRNALAQAAAEDSAENDSANTENGNSETEITGTVPYKEGIYYGTAEGYIGDITVAVVIQDHTIKAILVMESEDDEEFLNRAMEVARNVVKKQNTEVDLVSGATYSSRGILEAIKKALKEAEMITNGTLSEEDNNGTDEENKDDVEEIGKIYQNGEYSAAVLCLPDEDEEFEAYQLSLKITVKGDKIIEIKDIAGDEDESNDRYIKRAAEGTSSVPGVVTQILEKGTLEEIDTVSRATCSSKAILEACEMALENARKTAETGDEK